jgi:ABC-type lipoprotein release transport system permease subunit
VITAALVALALAIGVAGLLWIASASARHQRLAAPDVDVLVSLGATARERRVLLVGSAAPAIAAGVALAPTLAVALSPLFPVGRARQVDPDPGLHVDGVVLVAGGVTLAVILALIAMLTATRIVAKGHRQTPGSLRVPRLVDGAARLLRPAPATGVRFALSAPPRSSTPVRAALAGALVGVIGLVAVAVIGASLQRLVDVPARWGTTWDVAVEAGQFVTDDAAPEDETAAEPDREALVANPDIEAAAIVLYDEQVTVNGVEAIAMTFDPVKGGIAPTVIQGREPRSEDEIALGSDTLRSVGVEVGTTVRVGSRSQVSEEYHVVGVIAFPTIGEPTTVATGATLTARGGDRLLLGTGGDDAGTAYVVLRWAAGVDHDEALTRLGIEANAGASDASAIGPAAPPEVSGLIDVQQFPLLAGVALAVLGVISTSHALLVTVRRRRLELGVLSALGFAPAQRRATIVGQATTITLIALVVGIPVGAVVGRLVWSIIAESIGVATDASFPLVLLAFGAIGFMAALNAIAAFPARSARRLRVADALRSE